MKSSATFDKDEEQVQHYDKNDIVSVEWDKNY